MQLVAKLVMKDPLMHCPLQFEKLSYRRVTSFSNITTSNNNDTILELLIVIPWSHSDAPQYCRKTIRRYLVGNGGGVAFILRFRASAKVPANSLVVSLVVKVTLYEMNFSS